VENITFFTKKTETKQRVKGEYESYSRIEGDLGVVSLKDGTALFLDWYKLPKQYKTSYRIDILQITEKIINGLPKNIDNKSCLGKNETDVTV